MIMTIEIQAKPEQVERLINILERIADTLDNIRMDLGEIMQDTGEGRGKFAVNVRNIDQN
jgi:hypothetical protein